MDHIYSKTVTPKYTDTSDSQKKPSFLHVDHGYFIGSKPATTSEKRKRDSSTSTGKTPKQEQKFCLCFVKHPLDGRKESLYFLSIVLWSQHWP